MDVQHSLKRQNGVTMIEVLVAVVILAFGIASIGVMMLTALQDGRGAMYRSRAVSLAQDMAERIITNYSGREHYEVGEDDEGVDHNCFSTGSPGCSAQQLAENDTYQWKELLTDIELGLPDSTGTVAIDGTTSPPEYEISVSWTNGVDAAGDVTESLTLRVRP